VKLVEFPDSREEVFTVWPRAGTANNRERRRAKVFMSGRG
jgi:hypothetical protein